MRASLISALLMLAPLMQGSARAGVEEHEGYFSPVFSRDGRFVYFIERHARGTVQGEPIEFFTPPADVLITSDVVALRRVDVETGAIRELRRFQPLPTIGERFKEYRGSIFSILATSLWVNEDGGVDYRICIDLPGSPLSRSFGVLGKWSEGQELDAPPQAWREFPCDAALPNHWPLFEELEVIPVPGREFFAAALVIYAHETSRSKVLLATSEFGKLYPHGIDPRKLEELSSRGRLEKFVEMEKVSEELAKRFRAQGVPEDAVRWRVWEELGRLGYFPKPTMVTARPLDRAELARLTIDKDALFVIEKGEMDTGIFEDIDKAIHAPNTEIEKGMGQYIRHRDYTNSARLNAFLDKGESRFYVRYLGKTYEMTIHKPS